MIHNHERLLIKLIEQYYGLIPSLAARLLLNHNAILMKRALEYTELKPVDFKRGLDVLVRCNLAKIVDVKRQKLIEIHSDKIINLIYYPYYLVVVNKRFGVESVSLLKTLILYGNLSTEILIERTLLHIIQINALDVVEEQIRAFISVLDAKYQELCSNRIIIVANKNHNNNSQSIGMPPNCNVEIICKSLMKRFGKTFTGTSNKENVKQSDSTECTFNCDVLNYLLFIELFPYFSSQPFPNEEANFVFRLLLEMTFEKSCNMKTKTLLPFKEILCKYSDNYPTFNVSKLATILRTFSHFFAPDFIRITEKSSECFLDFNAFLFDIVKIIVKEFVKKNFGENAVRIFGALLQEPCIFENNLLTSLKIDTKELHRNLYQLDQNRMINVNFYSEASQSSTFAARNIKKAFSVNLNEVVSYIMNQCYYSLFSMLHRRHIALDDQRDLITRKTHIENYKKEIVEQVDDKEEQNELIKTAHNYMSEIDHQKAESCITYDGKIDKVMHNLVNHLFILHTWKNLDDSITEQNRRESNF